LKIKYSKHELNLINSAKFKEILKKIHNNQNYNNLNGITAYDYFNQILSKSEFDIFLSNIPNPNQLNNNISDYMKHQFFDLNPELAKHYVKISNGTQLITDKLAEFVQDKLYLNHKVQEITYMPITKSYLLFINNQFIHAEKLIICTDASIKYIRLNLPRPIIQTFNNIKSYDSIRIFIKFINKVNNIIRPDTVYLNKFGKIVSVNSDIISIDINNGSAPNIIYKTILDPENKSKSIKYLELLLEKIFPDIKFLPIDDYIFCYWKNSSHSNTQRLKTNYWSEYNLILAGEWTSSWQNTLEGSCLSAIDTFEYIKNNMFVDKLKHKPDNSLK
jgi:hypothetical protein